MRSLGFINTRFISKTLANRKGTPAMVAFMSFSRIINSVITMAAGILVARWIMPEELGFFTGFSIISSYIILSQLGIPSGLSRELPRYMGKGDDSKAKEAAAVSHYFELGLGLIILVLSFITSLILLIKGLYEYAAGAMVVGFTSFQGLYVTKYLKILYRSNNDFNKLSVISLINTFVAAASVILVWKFAFYGLCARAVIIFVVDLFFTWKWKPLDVKPAWNRSVFREIMKIGFPIYWVSNVYGLWPVLQRTIVITYLGTRAMGLYSIALMVDTSMKIISNSLSSVTFVKMSHSFGQGASIKALIRQPAKLIIAVFFLNLFLALIAYFVIPPFIKYFLPNYIDGISAAQWMVWVGAIGVLGVFQNVYMVIEKNMDRLYAYIAGVVVWIIVLALLFLSKGPEIEILPQSLLAAYLAIYIVNFLHFKRYSKKGEV